MPRRGRIIALEGPSGSGKSTLAARLASDRGWALLAEAVDRIYPPVSLRFSSPTELLRLERRLLEEEARRFTTARELSAQGETVLADTGFVGPVSYTAGLLAMGRCPSATYLAIVRAASALASGSSLGLPDLSVYLEVPARERARRAAADPDRHPKEFRQRHEDVGLFEQTVFRPWLAVRLPGRVRRLRAIHAPEELAGRIVRLGRDTRPLRDPAGRLHGLLLRWGELPFEGRFAQLAAAATVKKGTPPARAPAA